MEIQRYSAAAQRISELLAERPDVKESADAIPLPQAPRRITLDGIRFSYGDRTVLDDVSLEISAGETIGVAGPSGAGKTTLLSVVARFYDPTSGAVRFDGVDLRRFRLGDVYDQFAIVTQEAVPVSHLGAGQHPPRPAFGERCRDRGRREDRRDPRRDPGAAGGLRHDRRRRRPDRLGRTGPAHQRGAGAAQERARPAARRGDLEPRLDRGGKGAAARSRS